MPPNTRPTSRAEGKTARRLLLPSLAVLAVVVSASSSAVSMARREEPLLALLAAIAGTPDPGRPSSTLLGLLALAGACLWLGLAWQRRTWGILASLALSVATVSAAELGDTFFATCPASTLAVLAVGLTTSQERTISRRRALFRALLSGLLAGCAALVRKEAWCVSIPLLLWIAAGCSPAGAPLEGRASHTIRRVSGFLAGWVGVVMMAAGVCLATSHTVVWKTWLERPWLQGGIGGRLGPEEAMLAFPQESLVAYALALPPMAAWLGQLAEGPYGLLRAWRARGLETTISLLALVFLPLSPFFTADLGMTVALAGPWLGFSAAVQAGWLLDQGAPGVRLEAESP